MSCDRRMLEEKRIEPPAVCMRCQRRVAIVDEAELCLKCAKGNPNDEFYTLKHELPAIGRNAACPCGSGRKYKHCCIVCVWLLFAALVGCDGVQIGEPAAVLPAPAVETPRTDISLNELRRLEREREIAGYWSTVLVRVNDYRREEGRSELKFSYELKTYAVEWAKHMAETGDFRHSEGIAENIARGQRSPEEVLESWKQSAYHRANMLGEFEFFGAGVAASSSGELYWVLVLR